MNPPPTFVLASASPARLKTLQAAGLDPRAIVSGVDESIVELQASGDGTAGLCATLARLKAEAVARQLGPVDRPTLVLGCDSLLEFDGRSMGKPADPDEAQARWRRMRGRSGTLHTGHCLVSVADGRRAEAVTGAEVHFADASDEEISAYVGTGEPLQVAGAFTIDGLGGWFVDRIVGDPGTVVGVSLPTLRQLLRDLGVSIPALWSLH